MSSKQPALRSTTRRSRACALIGPPSGAHKQSSAAFTFPFFLFSFSFFFACFHPSSSPCLKPQRNILDASGTRFHHQISLLLEQLSSFPRIVSPNRTLLDLHKVANGHSWR